VPEGVYEHFAGGVGVRGGKARAGWTQLFNAYRTKYPELAAEIQKHGRRARVLADADEIVKTIAPEMRSGDVVALLSNGGFGGIYEKLPARLRVLAGEGGSLNAANAAGNR